MGKADHPPELKRQRTGMGQGHRATPDAPFPANCHHVFGAPLILSHHRTTENWIRTLVHLAVGFRLLS